MKLLSNIPSWAKNKYLITVVAFVIWMIFFDAKDIFTHRERSNELRELQESRAYYISEIAKAAIEKYAREKYLMKRDNEDLFIIQKPAKD